MMQALQMLSIVTCLLGSRLCLGQEADPAAIATRTAHVRLGYERVTLPGSEGMGLVGTSYLVDWADSGLSIGPAVYGSINGRRGGFYTLGGEISWRRSLIGPLGVELGIYAGGGGGGSAPQGGGLMLRPHADVWWKVGPGSLAISLSRVRFPNGQIDSTQLGLAWTLDVPFRFAPAAAAGSRVVGDGRSGVGFDRVLAVVGAYRSRAGATRLDGAPLPSTIGYVGIRAERAWGANSYWGIEANGAASGGVAGYAEYLATLGMASALVPGRLTVGGRVALGMGGGGGVAVGGGLLAKASVQAALQLTPDQAVAIEAGVVDAPQGRFRAAQGSVAWIWTLDREGGGAWTTVTRTEFAAGIEAFHAARRDGTTRTLTADVLKVSRFLSPHLYLTGQAHSAVAGDAGGYSAGYFGMGWRQPLSSRWQVSAELLAGAAGGGGVDTGGGALLQPMMSVGWRLGPSLTLHVSAGRVKALGGRVASPVVEASLAFSYGVTGRTAPPE